MIQPSGFDEKKTNPLFTPNAIMSITHHCKARGFNNVAAFAGAVRRCATLSHYIKNLPENYGLE